MKVVVLDDYDDAVRYGRLALARFRDDTTFDVPLDEGLSSPITGSLYVQRIRELEKDLKGEAVVFLDLRYNILSQADNAGLVADLRFKYEGENVSDPLDSVRLDGFVLGCALIDNPEFWGTIVVRTGAEGGVPLPVRKLKERVGKKSRDQAVQITWEAYGLKEAMQEYREGHRFDDSEEPVRKNILKHIAFFYGKDPGGVPAAGRHLDRFVRFMLMAAELDHDACKEPENVDAAFPHLLDMPVVEFRAKVIGRLTKGRHVLSEALKTMGVRLSQEDKTARPLTVVGGWLLALGAFRTVDPGRDWDQVFNLTDLNNEELQYYKLLSPQELIGYKQSLRLFFTLCQRLFENVHPTAARPHGPLLQVTARSEAGGKQGGLFFHLDFSYMQPCLGRDKSLKERIEDYWKAVDRGQDPQKHGASGALGQFRQIQDPGGVWEDPTAQGANLCLVHVRPVSLSSRDEATEVYFT